MTTGLNGKVMTYDGENRPLSVTSTNGDLTEYIYAADGTRLKRTVTVGANTTTSLYLGDVEIVNSGSTDTTHWYLHPNVRVTHKSTGSPSVNYLHRDQLSSVVLIANAAGGVDWKRLFAPFGKQNEYGNTGSTVTEDYGFIGERLDAVAGLQFLNARYYDPELGLFTQPDWLDVRLPGVGTNRYSYSFNDPVNITDPNGSCTNDATCEGTWDDDPTKTADDRQSEDGVADASIYDGRDTYVLDPEKIGLDEILNVGTAIQRYILGNSRAYQNSDLKRAVDQSIATGEPVQFSITRLGIPVSLLEKNPLKQELFTVTF